MFGGALETTWGDEVAKADWPHIQAHPIEEGQQRHYLPCGSKAKEEYKSKYY